MLQKYRSARPWAFAGSRTNVVERHDWKYDVDHSHGGARHRQGYKMASLRPPRPHDQQTTSPAAVQSSTSLPKQALWSNHPCLSTYTTPNHTHDLISTTTYPD